MGQRNARGNWRQCQDPDHVGHGKGFFCWPCRGSGRNSQKSARYQIECMKWLYSRVLKISKVEIQTTLGMIKDLLCWPCGGSVMNSQKSACYQTDHMKWLWSSVFRNVNLKKFSKVSPLPHWTHKMALEPSFENFQFQDPMRCGKRLCYWQVVAILTSQPTAKLTMRVLRISNPNWIYEFWEFQIQNDYMSFENFQCHKTPNWLWQFPVRTPSVQNNDFLLRLVEKLKMTFWEISQIKSHKTKRFVCQKISQNEAFCLWFQFFLWASNADRMFV